MNNDIFSTEAIVLTSFI